MSKVIAYARPDRVRLYVPLIDSTSGREIMPFDRRREIDVPVADYTQEIRDALEGSYENALLKEALD